MRVSLQRGFKWHFYLVSSRTRKLAGMPFFMPGLPKWSIDVWQLGEFRWKPGFFKWGFNWLWIAGTWYWDGKK